MIKLGAVTWVARVSGTAIRKQKDEERIMGWMFDNVGRLIAWLQKPADNCEPFTPNDSMALPDTLRPGMARTLRMGENTFRRPCNFKELRVAKRAHITTCALCA
jgi:hypothetical protein